MRVPISPRILLPGALVVYHVSRAWVSRRVHDPHAVLARATAGERLVFACRHGQLLPLLPAMEPYGLTVVVSRSHDGEVLASVLRRQGFGLIRGSTSAAGLTVGKAALRALQEGARLGVAVDGPRGPRGQVHDGVLRIAQRAGVPIVPLRASTSRGWIAPGSWDHFELPGPAAAVDVRVGLPIGVGPGESGLDRAGEALAAVLGGWRSPRTDPGVPTQPHPSYGHP